MDLPQPPSRRSDPLVATGGADHPVPNDKRTSPRYPYQRKALCQASPAMPGQFPKGGGNPGSVWFMGTSQDLSASGIGFILHHRFDPGTVLTIELERPKLDSWSRLPARVMHATPQADGNWKLGCVLVHAMSEQELRSWINGQGNKIAARHQV